MRRATYSIKDVYMKGSGTVVGPLEKAGPLGSYFDKYYDDNYCGEKNWEHAEIRLLKDALALAIVNSGLAAKDIDLGIMGDLINQTAISNYAMRDYDFPFMGIYGACSTSVQALITASLLLETRKFENIIVGTSSHNSSAEKQFRYPTEYGGPKPETATYTVTGAGSCVLSSDKSDIKIRVATIGRVVDANQKNPYDIGTAMAPAAADTILRHIRELNLTVDYYDMIVTGDLSDFGSKVLIDILKQENLDISKIHHDCGKMIYSENQPVFAGGSGCACCATVLFGYLKKLLSEDKVKKILVVATGALHNPVMLQQKETIPGIAHALGIEKS